MHSSQHKVLSENELLKDELENLNQIKNNLDKKINQEDQLLRYSETHLNQVSSKNQELDINNRNHQVKEHKLEREILDLKD